MNRLYCIVMINITKSLIMLYSPKQFSVGSTWAQEMVWCICNDLDYAKAKSMIGQLRTPLLE